MVKGVILVDWTDQGRRAIKDSPDRAEAAKAEATKLGQVDFLAQGTLYPDVIESVSFKGPPGQRPLLYPRRTT